MRNKINYFFIIAVIVSLGVMLYGYFNRGALMYNPNSMNFLYWLNFGVVPLFWTSLGALLSQLIVFTRQESPKKNNFTKTLFFIGFLFIISVATMVALNFNLKGTTIPFMVNTLSFVLKNPAVFLVAGLFMGTVID
ncbi:MAG: hypothetical protein QMB63_02440 [Clostridiaceae bacterium]